MRENSWIKRAGLVVGLVATGLVFCHCSGSGTQLQATEVTYSLAAAGTTVPFCPSASGLNTLALPYQPPTGLDDSRDLLQSINLANGIAKEVRRYDEQSDGWITFFSTDQPFTLKAGEALLVRVAQSSTYPITGSHDPTADIPLEGPTDSGSASGMNFVALPLVSIVVDAQGLINDIGAGNVDEVRRFNRCTDAWETFAGGNEGENFPIEHGEGYLVKMKSSVDWRPTHFGASGTALQYELVAEGEDLPECESASGANTLALPYLPDGDVRTARGLFDAIGAEGGAVRNVQRYKGGGNWAVYDGSGDDFPLPAGEAVLVQMDSDLDYSITGRHDPSVVLSLDGPGGDSPRGMNFIALPYHATAENAQDLIEQIGALDVEEVQRFNECTDTWESWSGGGPGQRNFPLKPGEGYMVKMRSTVNWVPAYY